MTSDLLPAVPAVGHLDAYTPDAIRQLVARWLLTVRSEHSRHAYANDLGLRLAGGLEVRPDGVGWLPFLAGLDVYPLAARRVHVDVWVQHMRSGTPDVRPAAEATIARRLAAVSSWYAYLVGEEITDRNPVAHVKRPRSESDYSPTAGMSRDQARAVLAAAAAYSPTAHAMLSLCLHSMLRVSEVCGVDYDNIGVDSGYPVVTVLGKGNKRARLPLTPHTVDALTALRVHRAALLGVDPAELTGPVFLSPTGRRMTRQSAAKLVGRVGRRAGLPFTLTPHGCRHTAITLALNANVPLRDVQDTARHADPKTTRGYDLLRGEPRRSAVLTLAEHLEAP